MRISKRFEQREVSCLFVTKGAAVLLMSKDGENWHFPQAEARRDGHGKTIESPQAAIARLCALFDNASQEEETFLERTEEHLSHHGIETTYHIFSTDQTRLKDTDLLSTGCKLVWTDTPHVYKLNRCTREILIDHGIEPS